MALKYLYVPSGYKAGTTYGVLPNSANADFSSFSRGSAGSRVDKNGFINTGLGLGSEEVVNGGFDSASNWETSVATISGGKAIFISATGAYSYVRQVGVLTQNKTYEVVIDLVVNSGNGIKLQDASGTTFSVISESGVHTRRFTATTTNSTLVIAREFISGAYDMYVERVSVREVTEVNTDVPRLDHTGGGCPSLLLEPTSTNYVEYSEDFTQSSWSKFNSTITSNTGISPDGSQNADKLYFNGTFNSALKEVITTTNTNVYTFSIWIKKISANYTSNDKARIEAFGSGTVGTLLLGDALNSAVVGEFVRYSITTTASTGGTSYFQFRSDEEATFEVWGAQVEPLSYATSYIPNYGTAAGVTRSADDAGGTGDLSNVINSSEGVLYVNVAALSSNGSSRRITLNNGTTSNRLIFQYSSTSNQINYYFVVGGTNQCSMSHTLSNAMDYSKVALKYKENDFALWVNGVEVGTENSGNTLSAGTLNSLNFDGATGNYPFYGRCKEIRIYDEALNDAEMVKLTTL